MHKLLVRRTEARVDKVMLGSILIATMVIPIRAGAALDARRGLRAALVGMVMFNLTYLALLRFIYPRVI